MTIFAKPPRWDRASLAVVVSLCAVKALLHLALVSRYGYHGDELYFLECGRHLAFGYVDHPPLIPWIARLADELGGSLLALRLPAIAAGTGAMVFAALLVREWGGQVVPQVDESVDFVVVGTGQLSGTELKGRPMSAVVEEMMDTRHKEFAQRKSVIDQARNLNIPVLTQTQFLYLTGERGGAFAQR